MPRIVLTILVAAGAAFAVVSLTRDDSEKAARASTVSSPTIDPKAAPAQIPRKPPVVMIVMDEFPVDIMLGADGRIDAARYPNFAALAATGTWFKNAHTIYDSTTKAIPAVLTGRLPEKGGDATYKSHPRTVFDLFGPRGYRIVKSEEATSLCPPRYCRGAKPHRPAILPLLQRGRRERLERFFAAVKPGAGFYMKHVLLPHGPYQYLPSGKQTRNGYQDPVPGMNSPPGFGDRFLTQHNEQRIQLQTGYADRQLGNLFKRMVANGSFDQALIVVVADHGFAFEVGVKDRRTVTRRNIDEVAPVPLFIKAPGQRRGRTSGTYARTTDVVPTMADVLNVKMPYRADGRSAFSRSVRRRRFVRMIRRKFNGTITVSARRMEARRRANVRSKLRLFGSGDIATLYTGIGPNRSLLGRKAADLKPAGQGRVRASVSGAANVRAVRASSLLLPTQIAGPVRGGRRGAKRDVAVAVNGRIEAVGRTFYLRGKRQENFAVNVPEAVIRPGRNTVEVFQVSRGKLTLIGRA
jgi:Sulfatase